MGRGGKGGPEGKVEGRGTGGGRGGKKGEGLEGRGKGRKGRRGGDGEGVVTLESDGSVQRPDEQVNKGRTLHKQVHMHCRAEQFADACVVHVHGYFT